MNPRLLIFSLLLVSVPALAQEEPTPMDTVESPLELDADPDALRVRRIDLSSAQVGRLTLSTAPALSLEEVLDSVNRHYPVLLRARGEIDIARADALSARGGFDLLLDAKFVATPVGYYDTGRMGVTAYQYTPYWGLSAYAGWRRGRGNYATYYEGYETLEYGEFRAGVELPLLRDRAIDYRRGEILVADLYVAQNEAYADAYRFQVAEEAAKKYFDWVMAGLKYRVALQILDLAVQRNQQIVARVESGAIAELEAVENQRTILSRTEKVIEARRGLEQKAIALSIYLRDENGLPVLPTPEQLPATLPQVGLSTELDTESLLDVAIVQRPEAIVFEQRQEIADVKIQLAENEYLPSLRVGVGFSQDFGNNPSAFNFTSSDPAIETMVNFSMPLQRREARGELEAAQIERDLIELDVRFFQDQLRLAIQDQLSAIDAANDQLAVAQDNLTVARMLAQAEYRRFELGASTLLTVNIREQSLADAQVAVVEAEAGVMVARAQLRALIGDPALFASD